MGYMHPFALATLVASRLDLTMKVIWRGNTSGSAGKIKGSGFRDSRLLIPQPRQLGPYHSFCPHYRGWDSWKWLGQKGPSCLGDLSFNRDEMETAVIQGFVVGNNVMMVTKTIKTGTLS